MDRTWKAKRSPQAKWTMLSCQVNGRDLNGKVFMFTDLIFIWGIRGLMWSHSIPHVTMKQSLGWPFFSMWNIEEDGIYPYLHIQTSQRHFQEYVWDQEWYNMHDVVCKPLIWHLHAYMQVINTKVEYQSVRHSYSPHVLPTVRHKILRLTFKRELFSYRPVICPTACLFVLTPQKQLWGQLCGRAIGGFHTHPSAIF